MIFTSEGKVRSFRENVAATISLAGVAGFVNSAGFVAVGLYTSHVTGDVSRLATAGADGNWVFAADLAVIIAAFFFGAFTSSMIVELTNLTRWRAESRYALPFVLQVAILTSIAVWGFTHGDLDKWLAALGLDPGLPLRDPPPTNLFTYALTFSMGMQNALLTRVAGSVVRTTHLTGVVTDLGLETAGLISAVFQWLRHRWLGGTHQSLGSMLNLKPLIVHWGIFFSFLFCGVLGALAFRAIGYASFLFPALALLVLSFTSVMRLAIESQERLWKLMITTAEVPRRNRRLGRRSAMFGKKAAKKPPSLHEAEASEKNEGKAE